jgi:ubiquinone/menaquinone biosynthesis C-methylase UbiE
MAEMFSNASSYEKFMGRWSARLAPLFVEFARVRDGDRVLDIGCGIRDDTARFARIIKQGNIKLEY